MNFNYILCSELRDKLLAAPKKVKEEIYFSDSAQEGFRAWLMSMADDVRHTREEKQKRKKQDQEYFDFFDPFFYIRDYYNRRSFFSSFYSPFIWPSIENEVIDTTYEVVEPKLLGDGRKQIEME